MLSLSRLAGRISDKEIYEKQQKGYNIINVQPKEYCDTLRVYSKYRFEDLDRNYFKKLEIEAKINEGNGRKIMNSSKMDNEGVRTERNHERK